ncbi:hemerythrin domain-containing protein [Ramlibacter sp. PS3R-8]|uniref:hemerythrin domain-containing protein n=1 Tax=Ramlibacter sp. PS3R-8 TaxID=3133437 RepID=UPI00309593BF
MTYQLSLGDAVLDDDHSCLAQLMEQLRDGPIAQAVITLDGLREHAHRHFELENLELRNMKDGNAQCHIDEHAAVLQSLGEVRTFLIDDGMSQDAKAALVQRLAARLIEWLPEHVHAMDAGVAAHRFKQRFDGAPIIVRRLAG